jgi:hypothetical protein
MRVQLLAMALGLVQAFRHHCATPENEDVSQMEHGASSEAGSGIRVYRSFEVATGREEESDARWGDLSPLREVQSASEPTFFLKISFVTCVSPPESPCLQICLG